MDLKKSQDLVQWPAMHYVYVEKIGSFMQTAGACWKEVNSLKAEIQKNNQIVGAMALYKIEPQMIYRAGFRVASAPKNLPAGTASCEFKGGTFTCFTLKGSYAQLPEACGIAFQQYKAANLQKRDDFYIEHYVNDPATTPAENLVTEILIPTK